MALICFIIKSLPESAIIGLVAWLKAANRVFLNCGRESQRAHDAELKGKLKRVMKFNELITDL